MGRIRESHSLVEQCYLNIKDRPEAHAAFIEQTKKVLEQLVQIQARQAASASAVQNNETPLRIQPQKTLEAPVILPSGSYDPRKLDMNPSSLVPTHTIQKPLEFKP
jgi:hypothetical protein